MHQPVYFIDQGRPLADEPLTHPVQRVEILLVDVLEGDKAHGRPCHRFGNGLGIAPIVCVRLHVGLDKLGSHAFDLMALNVPVGVKVRLGPGQPRRAGGRLPRPVR
jgi:hypothetical protein